ncbi:MAG: cell division protein ZapA [Candidatus Marinimicrobia bacterium]|nr:cell division protein ZapA [Candidatus Neomarinimicrobiota bacterium]MCF7904471.1 cell division protein ZapA [Candidatus Neomarinimicrobiota bacterium]
MDTHDNNTVQVMIHGKSYTIKGKADSSYISGVANYVDMKMREVEEGANTAQEEGKVAILAGMNITDELFSIRQDKERIENRFEERVQALTELIDETLST